jgi:nucleoside-diphosphate-sugar epimerase
LKSIVTIKTAGLTDWASLAAAAAALAADGRLRDAVDHLAAQSGPPAEISAWLDKAQQRLDADSDLTHITAAVMNLAVAP